MVSFHYGTDQMRSGATQFMLRTVMAGIPMSTGADASDRIGRFHTALLQSYNVASHDEDHRQSGLVTPKQANAFASLLSIHFVHRPALAKNIDGTDGTKQLASMKHELWESCVTSAF